VLCCDLFISCHERWSTIKTELPTFPRPLPPPLDLANTFENVTDRHCIMSYHIIIHHSYGLWLLNFVTAWSRAESLPDSVPNNSKFTESSYAIITILYNIMSFHILYYMSFHTILLACHVLYFYSLLPGLRFSHIYVVFITKLLIPSLFPLLLWFIRVDFTKPTNANGEGNTHSRVILPLYGLY
jgi:hypothetical protein